MLGVIATFIILSNYPTFVNHIIIFIFLNPPFIRTASHHICRFLFTLQQWPPHFAVSVQLRSTASLLLLLIGAAPIRPAQNKPQVQLGGPRFSVQFLSTQMRLKSSRRRRFRFRGRIRKWISPDPSSGRGVSPKRRRWSWGKWPFRPPRSTTKCTTPRSPPGSRLTFRDAGFAEWPENSPGVFSDYSIIR